MQYSQLSCPASYDLYASYFCYNIEQNQKSKNFGFGVNVYQTTCETSYSIYEGITDYVIIQY